jgi:murein DD-endopeptidase MepM/ murein hydrolase activator NlpD
VCGSAFGDPSEAAYTLPDPAGCSYPSFCPPNPSWGHYNWFAYDFGLAIGDSVVAARSGRVIAGRDQFTDGTRVCGEENLVYVQHDDGSVASYVHLTRSGFRVTVGQRVEAGALLGLSGDSGCSSGPHLHFAVFRRMPNLSRKYTLPINLRNVTGALSPRGGLQHLTSYKAR